MALDWNKEISFTGKRRSASKARSGYPEKTYMNLMVQSKRTRDVRRSVPLAVVLVVIVALFAKFGVYDFFDRVHQEEMRLSQSKSALNQMNLLLQNYDDVLEEYESYDTEHLAADMETVSTMDALDLVDRVVASHAHVRAIGLTGNTITLSVSDITLDSVGSLVSLLYEDPAVANVTVSTASNQEASGSDVTTVMTITLQRAEE